MKIVTKKKKPKNTYISAIQENPYINTFCAQQIGLLIRTWNVPVTQLPIIPGLR